MGEISTIGLDIAKSPPRPYRQSNFRIKTILRRHNKQLRRRTKSIQADLIKSIARFVNDDRGAEHVTATENLSRQCTDLVRHRSRCRSEGDDGKAGHDLRRFDSTRRVNTHEAGRCCVRGGTNRDRRS